MHQKPFVFILLTGVFLFAFESFALADFQSGKDAFDKGDYQTALKEWWPLAEQGDIAAQSMLTQMYQHDQGIPPDTAQIIQWYRNAAGDGNARAKYYYKPYQGQGDSQDYAEAMRWYRGAAQQGKASAQVALGINYVLGKGVPIDYVQAHFWFTLAAAHGDSDGTRLKDKIEKEMNFEQLAKAERLAREWKIKSPKRKD